MMFPKNHPHNPWLAMGSAIMHIMKMTTSSRLPRPSRRDTRRRGIIRRRRLTNITSALGAGTTSAMLPI